MERHDWNLVFIYFIVFLDHHSTETLDSTHYYEATYYYKAYHYSKAYHYYDSQARCRKGLVRKILGQHKEYFLDSFLMAFCISIIFYINN